MANEYFYNLPHWRFYLSLEDDLERCFKYVSPQEEHFEVHSDEFAKIILVAASEFENVLQEFKHESKSNCDKNINGYRNLIGEKYPNATSMRLNVLRYSLNISPLTDWHQTNSPDWWRSGYNKIKHDRAGNPKAPTLIKSLYATGSLQIILLHFYRFKYGNISIPSSLAPRLMEPETGYFQDSWGPSRTVSQWFWRLPDDPVMQTE